jgi:putative endonuclease
VSCYWVYILENDSGRFYVGQTGNPDIRLISHNRTDKILGKYTRKHGPWRLAWLEEHPDRSSAMCREKQIKSWKSSRTIRMKLLDLPE